MKTKTDVVTTIFNLIKTQGTVFRNSYPDGYSQECIVVNTLPVMHDPLQDVVVNVNIYKNDFQGGIPNEGAMVTASVSIIDILHGFHTRVFDKNGSTYVDKIHIQYESMDIIREESMNMHFMNCRFMLKFLNN